MRTRIFAVSVLLPMLSVVSGCAIEDASSEGGDDGKADGYGTDAKVVYLDQGWTPAERSWFYTTTQGARMLPYDWFLALEQATGTQKFRAVANMRRMGFLVDATSPANPDRLPVGFAKDVHPQRGASLGLTCAACHTGQLEVGGKAVRIDGGQGMIDLEVFQDGLLAALEATLADDAKFARFATAVLAGGDTTAARAELRGRVGGVRDWWSARIERSRGLSPHGPSRTDAFTIIANEVACKLLELPDNCQVASAPTQFPFLWSTPDLDWVQYNASVHNPLGRNVGEVTGVFGEQAFAADGTIESTVNIDNLFALEESLKKLTSPAWPEQVMGRIDHDLAAQGEPLYAAHCASCHTEDPQPRTTPNAYGVTFARVNFATPLSALGTDPTAARAFATRRALPGRLAPALATLGVIGPDGKVPVAALLNVATSGIIQRFFTVNGFAPAKQLQYVGFREALSPTTAQLTTYKARPLNGIAFTAPYLHNGSVPSIHQLLLPAAQRVKKFEVGNTRYDPKVLGYATTRTANSRTLDTAEVGNSNAGHEYGTGLTEPERMALIEYIKAL